MLRNIPNRANLEDLKQIIDETSFGSHDFMYLRIGMSLLLAGFAVTNAFADFANACNVGYAFINFVDVRPPFPITTLLTSSSLLRSSLLLKLVKIVAGINSIQTRLLRSPMPVSTFKCIASLANGVEAIQGRENLIAKFRNSSVMLESPSYRPKVIYSFPIH